MSRGHGWTCTAAIAAALLGATGSGAPTPAAEEPLAPSQSADDLAAGRLLVARRGLLGPIFGDSVVLLLEHGPEGAMGLIVNRPTELELRRLLPEFEGLAQRADRAWFGGPVQFDQALLLLIRAETPPQGAREVLAGVHASADPDTLRALLDDDTAHFRGYFGYAGWAPRQLEGELARGDWYVAPADAATIFSEAPEDVWPALIVHCEGLQVRGPSPLAPALGAHTLFRSSARF